MALIRKNMRLICNSPASMTMSCASLRHYAIPRFPRQLCDRYIRDEEKMTN